MDQTGPAPKRNRFKSVARIVGVLAIVLGGLTFILDKFLPYRIGPGYYAFCKMVFALAVVSLAVVCAALLLGIASRQWRPVIFAGVGLICVMTMNPVHSGPNPESWCYNNLRKIEAAKEQLAEKAGLTNGTVVTSEQISPYIEGGFDSLKCAEHGKYIINPIGTESRCSVHGSISEMEAKWKKASQ